MSDSGKVASFALSLLLVACGARGGLEVGGFSDAPDARGGPEPNTKACFTDLAAGGTSVCALRSDGALYCWGNNTAGQLGLPLLAGARQIRPPTRVEALAGVEAVSMGGEFGCAKTPDGLHCFGRDDFGQVGDGIQAVFGGTALVEGLPADLTGFSAGGTHACAIDSLSRLHCWGNNGWGALGFGFVSSPDLAGIDHAQHVVALENVSAVAAGEVHTCAVEGSTALYCWGGRASEPSYPSAGPPYPIFIADFPSPVRKIEAGNEFACAIGDDGILRCWGKNGWSVLGDGTNDHHETPAPIAGVDMAIVDVACSFEHACAAAADGSVFCWGINRGGALGRDPSIGENPEPFPQRVPGIEGRAVEVAIGYGFSCARTQEGEVWCWGNQDFGQLGALLENPIDRPTPGRVSLPCP
jgi:alpha-tubulin suppressor-like RCC1 family protein